jgi:hypothetical protein
MILNDLRFAIHGYFQNQISNQIKSPYFSMILKISKSSQNDLKSDFVKMLEIVEHPGYNSHRASAREWRVHVKDSETQVFSFSGKKRKKNRMMTRRLFDSTQH